MKKLSFLFLGIFIWLAFPFASADAASTDAYKAIVKIYTYYENSNFYLNNNGTGSGVIISSDGLVLTNYHVVDIRNNFDEEVPASFMVCVTASVSEKPECDFSADLIAKDEEKDIAILKIRNVTFAKENSFPFLERAKGVTYKNDDSVQAIGYPASGGETITGAMGTVLGNYEQYGLNWIKTNAAMSFGSSGGAMVDANNKLIGITSAMMDEMGLAIDMNSLNGWIDENLGKAATVSKLQERTDGFIKERNRLAKSDNFENAVPDIGFTKPSDWRFVYENENGVDAYNDKDQKGGNFSVVWDYTDTLFAPMLDITVKSLKLRYGYVDLGETTVAGIKGRKLMEPVDGEKERYLVLLPLKNYYINVLYYYGDENRNQKEVDAMLSSLKITDSGIDFAEQRKYENKDPFFSISLPDDYSLMPMNNVTNPVDGETSAVPEVSFHFYVEKASPGVMALNNKDYFEHIRDSEYIKSKTEDSLGYEAERYYENTAYRINSELNDGIFYKYRFKDKNDGGKFKYYAAGFRIRNKDKDIVIEYSYFGDSQKIFEEKLADFAKRVLINLSLGRPVAPARPETKALALKAKGIGQSFIGRILLRVGKSGEAWYLSPGTGKAFFLGRPADAFKVMREQGIGVTEKNFAAVEKNAPKSLAGKILLRVEANGEAYYVNPKDMKLVFLGRPADAFKVMRELGLGVSEANFANL